MKANVPLICARRLLLNLVVKMGTATCPNKSPLGPEPCLPNCCPVKERRQLLTGLPDWLFFKSGLDSFIAKRRNNNQLSAKKKCVSADCFSKNLQNYFFICYLSHKDWCVYYRQCVHWLRKRRIEFFPIPKFLLASFRTFFFWWVFRM